MKKKYVIITLLVLFITIGTSLTMNKREEEPIVLGENIVDTKKVEPLKEEPKKETKKVVNVKKQTTTKTKKTSTLGTYKITHYGWDCCKSGVTATGYNVKNTIYYNDKQYGNVRICAMSKSIPLYSIIKIKNYKLGGDITCIVIDRGVGNGVIDLLVQNEKTASNYGIQKGAKIEILRRGR